jgi:hypothetical protein
MLLQKGAATKRKREVFKCIEKFNNRAIPPAC